MATESSSTAQYQSVLVGPVELLMFEPAEAAKSEAEEPLLFVVHGRCERATKYTGLVDRLRRECPQLRVCMFDMANHGSRTINKDRNLSWFDRAPKGSTVATADCPGNALHAVDMYSQIVDTARTISLALDFLPALGVRCGRVGVAGVSQGAHAALHVFAHEPRLSVCVSIMGSGDYAGHLRARFDGGMAQSSEERWARLFPAALEQLCRRLDPVWHVDRLCGRPLLLVHGEADDLVLTKWSVGLHAKIQEHAAAVSLPMQASLFTVPGAGHSMTPEMQDAAAHFIRHNLLADQPSASL